METRAETLFLTKLIREGDSGSVMQLIKEGFNPELFASPFKEAIDYILKYRHKYKQLPTEEELVREFQSVSSELFFAQKTPKAAIGAIYDEIIKNSIRVDIIKYSEDLSEEFNKGTGIPLVEYVAKASRDLSSKYAKSRGRVSSLADIVPLLREDYEKVISGQADGVPIPFHFIQEDMHGWQPAQITTVLAKTGVGKTWFLMLCAAAAAAGDPHLFHRPEDVPAFTAERKSRLASRAVIVSCEMPAIDIARRIASLITGTSFNRLRAGKLSHEEHELYVRRLDNLIYSDKDKTVLGIGHNIRIVGPEVASSPEQILAQADDFDANIVLIDGFYYMGGQGEKRWEKVEGNMQQMRIHTLMSNRHYILASQFRRDSRALQTSTTDDAAFSVSIAQDSNNMIGLYQPKALKQSKQLDMSMLKQRDGSIGIPYRYRWDLYDMYFEQIGPVMENDGAQSTY